MKILIALGTEKPEVDIDAELVRLNKRLVSKLPDMEVESYTFTPKALAVIRQPLNAKETAKLLEALDAAVASSAAKKAEPVALAA